MQLTRNFTKSEFDSRDGATMPSEVLANIRKLAENLQVLRDSFGKPTFINSGYRSPAHNAAVGGVANSQHVLGTAADIRVSGVLPSQVADRIEELIAQGKMQEGGLGRYQSFTHYDIRSPRARWYG